ncbi:MAG: hypothetical protein CM1200mP36_08470 [Gammaproteobacteria bacterium]|nr:MAG: hypothetical protein CM1200mP36_08470 [Gammaproteobacteria bacterium]
MVSSYYSDGGGWPRQLWDFDKSYQWLGHAGGGGIGYGAPASVGGALLIVDTGGSRSLSRRTATLCTRREHSGRQPTIEFHFLA